jgi:hypothetical protein
VPENQSMGFDNFYGNRYSTWRASGGLPGADVPWPRKNHLEIPRIRPGF